ncbi:MAG: DUF4234 domain-containing protein [Gaiellaceae bacterium]
MATSGNAGPLGQPRGILFGILIFVITLGLYGIWWTWKTHEEVKQHSGQGVGGWLGIVIYFVIGVVTPFLIPSEVGKMYAQDGRPNPVSGMTGLWFIPGFIIIVGPIVWFVKVQSALNRYWESKGATA